MVATTLRRALTQSKPFIPCNTTAGKNSRGDWPILDSRTVTTWNEFNLETLNGSYGHILDLGIPDQQLAAPEPSQMLAPIEIDKPDDIKYLIEWNDNAVFPALELAKMHLNIHNGIRLQHKIAAPGGSALARIDTGPRMVQADHIISLDEAPLSNLVVGLGRPSSKFNGRRLANYPEHVPKEGFWPLRQLANLCNNSGTRYGYIMTEEAFLACRFSRTAMEPGWQVAVKPIPWTQHGENQLTTDLALWWLCMLAMSSPQNRALVGEYEMVGIDEWETRYLSDEQRWVRCHQYSRFEEPTTPPTPPAYSAPFPSGAIANAAVVAGQAVINADSQLNINPSTPQPASEELDLSAYLVSLPDAESNLLLEPPGIVDLAAHPSGH